MEFFTDFFDFIQLVWNEGVVQFFENVAAFFVKSAIYGTIEFMLWSTPFMWDIAKEILNEQQISQHMQTAFSAIDGEAANFIYSLKIPEAINIILTAFVTKFGLRVMGW